MTRSLDEQLAAALSAEADRSHEDPQAWSGIERRVARARKVRRTSAAAGLAVACLVTGVVIVQAPLAPDDDGVRVEIRDDPDLPSETTVPDGSPDPVGDQPGPAPTRDTPPETLVAVTTDGRLVVVDTATGEEVRQLASADDRHADFPGMLGSPDSIEHVALSPDGKDVWYDTCCAMDGRVYRVPVDGSASPEVAGNGYAPTFASSPAWIATVSDDQLDLNWPAGDWGRYWRDDNQYGGLQEVAWSLDGSRVVARTSGVESGVENGNLLVLDPSLMGDVEASDAVDYDHQEPRLIPGTWKLPAFRRDGRLVIAEQSPDSGLSIGRVLDIGSGPFGEIIPGEEFLYGSNGGDPLDQDFDPSGEWLLAVVDEPGADTGVLRWFGPDGQSGKVGSGYVAAAW